MIGALAHTHTHTDTRIKAHAHTHANTSTQARTGYVHAHREIATTTCVIKKIAHVSLSILNAADTTSAAACLFTRW